MSATAVGCRAFEKHPDRDDEATTASHDGTWNMRQILVVEPDDVMRALYMQSLQLAGYDVVEASDGRDALVKALAHPPALVMTATRLPVFDGYALCEVLRHDSMTRTVPILVVTTEPRPDNVARARAAGANSILVRPAPLDAVLNEVRRLLTPDAERSGVHPQKAQAKAQLRFDTTTPPARPPDLICPSCDRPLVYECSHIGGVSRRHAEQWDDYVCPASCGAFEYRHRTRKLRGGGGV